MNRAAKQRAAEPVLDHSPSKLERRVRGVRASEVESVSSLWWEGFRGEVEIVALAVALRPVSRAHRLDYGNRSRSTCRKVGDICRPCPPRTRPTDLVSHS